MIPLMNLQMNLHMNLQMIPLCKKVKVLNIIKKRKKNRIQKFVPYTIGYKFVIYAKVQSNLLYMKL